MGQFLSIGLAQEIVTSREEIRKNNFQKKNYDKKWNKSCYLT